MEQQVEEYLYKDEVQDYLPISVLYRSTSKIDLEDNQIKNIFYNFDVAQLSSTRVSRLNYQTLFSRLLSTNPNEEFRFSFVRNGETHFITVKGGCILDSNRKVLAGFVLNKTIYRQFNEQIKENKDVDLYWTSLSSQDKSEYEKKNLLKYTSFIITKDFKDTGKYKSICASLISLLKVKNYDVDIIVTQDIESRIFNLGKRIVTSYNSLREKIDFQKEVWAKVLT